VKIVVDVRIFQYLVTLIPVENYTSEDINMTIPAGNDLIMAFDIFVNPEQKTVSRTVKLKIFNVMLKLFVMYGCEKMVHN
jgi:hypothetical protein